MRQYDDILNDIVDNAIEQIRDGEDPNDAIAQAIEDETINDADRLEIAEYFGTIDLETAFNNAYDQLFTDVETTLNATMDKDGDRHASAHRTAAMDDVEFRVDAPEEYRNSIRDVLQRYMTDFEDDGAQVYVNTDRDGVSVSMSIPSDQIDPDYPLDEMARDNADEMTRNLRSYGLPFRVRVV